MPTALVTGPTAGIGAAFARRLGADGYDLVLASRDKSRLQALADELSAKHGITAEVLVADLGTEAGIAATEQRLADANTPVDLLVNNAGFGQQGTFLNVPIEDEQKMLRVHIEAVLRLTYAAVPGMQQRGGGAIINVASVGAFFPRGTYGASKAWVVSFTRGIAEDIAGTPITLQALCPGFVRTEFHQRAQMDVSRIASSMWLNADDVVAESLRDLEKGSIVSIPGRRYRTLVMAGRLLPPKMVGLISSRSARKYD